MFVAREDSNMHLLILYFLLGKISIKSTFAIEDFCPMSTSLNPNRLFVNYDCINYVFPRSYIRNLQTRIRESIRYARRWLETLQIPTCQSRMANRSPNQRLKVVEETFKPENCRSWSSYKFFLNCPYKANKQRDWWTLLLSENHSSDFQRRSKGCQNYLIHGFHENILQYGS